MTRMRIGKKKSTREEIGARNIDALGVETYGNEYLVYFLVQPDNIAVLSETAVKTKSWRCPASSKDWIPLSFPASIPEKTSTRTKCFTKSVWRKKKAPRYEKYWKRPDPSGQGADTDSFRKGVFVYPPLSQL